jgi:hypothetical protein
MTATAVDLPVFATAEQRRTALRMLSVAAEDLPPVVVRAKVWEWADRSLGSADRDRAWHDLIDAVETADALHRGELLPRDVAAGAPYLAAQVAEDDVQRALAGLVSER